MEAVNELTVFECYGGLFETFVEDIWLVEFKKKDAYGATARGWGLALVTKEDVIFMVPKIVDPNGPVRVSLRIAKKDKTTTGVEKMMALTAAGYGRRIGYGCYTGSEIPIYNKVALKCILCDMAVSGIAFFEAENGRGLRHWLCAVLFWFSSLRMIQEPKKEDQLHLKAVSLMRRCFKDGDTMEYMPIEAGRYDAHRLDRDASEAVSQSTDAIADLMKRERF
ncbi:hypothetical protein GGR58DRAFT_520118 [Xylaria digitata]|nr:hypothetical protein GGR58DRAFT_520118 [Xylaria digitata]